jgi:hypothetical protein
MTCRDFSVWPSPKRFSSRHGKPAGILIGFESEEAWFNYRLEHHPEFLRRVAAARDALREGRGVRLEELPS